MLNRQPLLLDVPDPFAKEAAVDQLPTNPESWPTHVLKRLYEEAPFVLEGTDYNVDLQKEDVENGNGYGMIMISNIPAPKTTGQARRTEYDKGKPDTGATPRQISIPFMIRSHELAPLDIFVGDDGTFYPLTVKRFKDIMLRSTPFVGVERPSQAAGGILGRQSPPPQLAIGYGAGWDQSERGGGRYASEEEGQEKRAYSSMYAREFLQMVSQGDGYYYSPGQTRAVDQIQFDNKHMPRIRKILERRGPTGDDMLDVAQAILPANVIRMIRRPSGHFKVIDVADAAYMPRTRILTEIEVMAEYGDRVENLLEHLAKDDVVITVDHDEREPLILENYKVKPSLLIRDAEVMVATTQGEFRRGRLFADVMSLDGHHLPLRVFTDGDIFAVQEIISGEVVGPASRVVTSPPRAGEWGLFAHADADGHVEVTLPFKVIETYTRYDRQHIVAQTRDGDPVVFAVEDGISKIYNARGASFVGLASRSGLGLYKVPASYAFVRLGQMEVVEQSPDRVNRAVQRMMMGGLQFHEGYLPSGAADGNPFVVVSKYMGDTYGMHGQPLDTIMGKEQLTGLSEKDVLFYLTILGLGVGGAQQVIDVAQTRKRVTVGNLRRANNVMSKAADIAAIRHDLEKICKSMRRDLRKDAEYVPSEDGLDALLSLNYITPETLEQFLAKRDILNQGESALAELLFMIRIGMEAVPESPVERSLRSLAEVNETLEYLAGHEKYQRGRSARKEEEPTPA